MTRAREFDLAFMESVRKLFEKKATLIPVNQGSQFLHDRRMHHYMRELPFTIEEQENTIKGVGKCFRYTIKGQSWTYTMDITITPRDDANGRGEFFDKDISEVSLDGDEQAFEADMISAKLML